LTAERQKHRPRTRSNRQAGAPALRPRPARPNTLDLANRLKSVVTELETGVPAEPGDLMTPSEKLRAIADLIDRRAATAAPPTEC
jgi:hypothetical protein